MLIKSVFPDWTDFDVASFGNLLVELYAYVGDALTFYQDNLARESRLVSPKARPVTTPPRRSPAPTGSASGAIFGLRAHGLACEG